MIKYINILICILRFNISSNSNNYLHRLKYYPVFIVFFFSIVGIILNNTIYSTSPHPIIYVINE